MAGRDLCPQGQNPDQPGHPPRTSFVGNKAVVPSAREFSYRRGRVHPKDVSATTFGFKLQNCSNCLSKDMPSDSSHQTKPKPPDLNGPKVPSVFKLSESQALPHGQQHFLPLSELSHQYNFPRATCFHLGPRLSLSPGTEAIVVLTVATIQVPGSAQTSAPLVSGTCPQPPPGHPPRGWCWVTLHPVSGGPMPVVSRDHPRGESVPVVWQNRPFSAPPSCQPIPTPSFHAGGQGGREQGQRAGSCHQDPTVPTRGLGLLPEMSWGKTNMGHIQTLWDRR